MKKYTMIHVGTRWGVDYSWGVMVEGVKPSAELLCVGCTQAQAEGMAAKLNERPADTVRLKMVAPAAALLVMVLLFSGCTIAPLKGGKATTSKSTQGIEQSVVQGDNPAAASRQSICRICLSASTAWTRRAPVCMAAAAWDSRS